MFKTKILFFVIIRSNNFNNFDVWTRRHFKINDPRFYPDSVILVRFLKPKWNKMDRKSNQLIQFWQNDALTTYIFAYYLYYLCTCVIISLVSSSSTYVRNQVQVKVFCKIPVVLWSKKSHHHHHLLLVRVVPSSPACYRNKSKKDTIPQQHTSTYLVERKLQQ